MELGNNLHLYRRNFPKGFVCFLKYFTLYCLFSRMHIILTERDMQFLVQTSFVPRFTVSKKNLQNLK